MVLVDPEARTTVVMREVIVGFVSTPGCTVTLGVVTQGRESGVLCSSNSEHSKYSPSSMMHRKNNTPVVCALGSTDDIVIERVEEGRTDKMLSRSSHELVKVSQVPNLLPDGKLKSRTMLLMHGRSPGSRHQHVSTTAQSESLAEGGLQLRHLDLAFSIAWHREVREKLCPRVSTCAPSISNGYFTRRC